MLSDNWIADAVEAVQAGGANVSATTSAETPRRKIGRARAAANTNVEVRDQTNSPPPKTARKPICRRGGDTEQGGQRVHVTHDPLAAPTIPGVHVEREAHTNGDAGETVAQIVENWRRRMDVLRARQRLELQAQAICRRYVDGDKAEAAKLWATVKGNPAHELRNWLDPFLSAIAPLDSAKAEIEKGLVKSLRKLPITEWSGAVLGLGELSLAGIIGECARGPGEYRTVSALWKRMGMAVIDGGRQRRIAGAAALDHGYNAERRSHMWNIGNSLIKAQLRSLKGEDGKKVEGSEYSLGELGTVYLERKAYLNARNAEREEPWTKAHIHNDAKRYMEKRLLRQLWQAWRQAKVQADSRVAAPAAEISGRATIPSSLTAETPAQEAA